MRPPVPAAYVDVLARFRRNPDSEELVGILRWIGMVRLGAEFEAHHVHTRRHVFRVRLRGTGGVVGKEVRLLVKVNGDGTPHGGGVENGDDIDAAIGDWIELEELEILKIR